MGVIAIAWRQLPLAPPGFRELQAAKSELPPLKDVGSPLGIPWGDLARPKLPRVYASGHHQKYLDGRVVIPLPDQVISRMSLHLGLPDHLDQPNPHWQLEEH